MSWRPPVGSSALGGPCLGARVLSPHHVGVRAASDHRVSAHTGKERLAACLGVTIQEASQFLESFLQKYKKIKDFAQATIARCRQTGKPAERQPEPSAGPPPPMSDLWQLGCPAPLASGWTDGRVVG